MKMIISLGQIYLPATNLISLLFFVISDFSICNRDKIGRPDFFIIAGLVKDCSFCFYKAKLYFSWYFHF